MVNMLKYDFILEVMGDVIARIQYFSSLSITSI